MEELRRLIEDRDTKGGLGWDITIQCLIVLSLVSFCLETLPALSQQARKILYLV